MHTRVVYLLGLLKVLKLDRYASITMHVEGLSALTVNFWKQRLQYFNSLSCFNSQDLQILDLDSLDHLWEQSSRIYEFGEHITTGHRRRNNSKRVFELMLSRLLNSEIIITVEYALQIPSCKETPSVDLKIFQIFWFLTLLVQIKFASCGFSTVT